MHGADEQRRENHAKNALSCTRSHASDQPRYNGPGLPQFQRHIEAPARTQIETNITTGGKEEWEVFSFIKNARIVRETRDGRMQEVEIELSNWVFNAINEKGGDILTISRAYFRLRKPLERRLYELARKWCGQSTYWHFSLDTMRERTGSTSSPKEFRRMLTKIIEDNQKHGHIPDYTFELDGDLVKVRPREHSPRYSRRTKTPARFH